MKDRVRQEGARLDETLKKKVMKFSMDENLCMNLYMNVVERRVCMGRSVWRNTGNGLTVY